MKRVMYTSSCAAVFGLGEGGKDASGHEFSEDDWAGAEGWVHDAVLGEYPDLSGYQVYMSGPPPMIDAARKDFAGHGLPESQLHFDSFEYALD